MSMVRMLFISCVAGLRSKAVRLPDFVDKRREFPLDDIKRELFGVHVALGYDNEVHALGQGLLVQAEEFAQQTFDAVAPDCVSQFPAYGHAQPPGGVGRGVVKREYYEMPGKKLLSLLVASKKLGTFQQPVLTRER